VTNHLYCAIRKCNTQSNFVLRSRNVSNRDGNDSIGQSSTSTTTCPLLIISKDSLLARDDWCEFRLVHSDEMARRVSSFLIIKATHCDIVAKLSPLEVYSADNLVTFPHSRMSGDAKFFPNDAIGEKVMIIGASVPCVIDCASLYHVAREDSSFFQEYGHLLADKNVCSDLCRAVIKYGKSDGSRSSGQFRVNLGCAGQHRPGGIPAKLVGLEFAESLDGDESFGKVPMLVAIGKLTEFLWNVMVGLQREAKDPPIAPDKRRHDAYGRHLSSYLKMNESVGFEDITLVASILSPRHDGVNEHCDQMNDSLIGYRRTGTLNMCFVLGDDIIIQFQVCVVAYSACHVFFEMRFLNYWI
jgi:hypothetical protein